MSTEEFERIVAKVGRVIALSGLVTAVVALIAANGNYEGSGPCAGAVWVVLTLAGVLLFNGIYLWSAFDRIGGGPSPDARTESEDDTEG